MLLAPVTICPKLPAPFNFFASCSFLTFPPLLFHFVRSLLLFTIFLLLHAPFYNVPLLHAPFAIFWSSLLQDYHFVLSAPLCQIGLAPCSGITPNRGSFNNRVNIYSSKRHDEKPSLTKYKIILHKWAIPPAFSKTVSGHDLLLFWNVELPVKSIPERQQVMNCRACQKNFFSS